MFGGRLLSLYQNFEGSLSNNNRYILKIKCEKQDPKIVGILVEKTNGTVIQRC